MGVTVVKLPRDIVVTWDTGYHTIPRSVLDFLSDLGLEREKDYQLMFQEETDIQMRSGGYYSSASARLEFHNRDNAILFKLSWIKSEY